MVELALEHMEFKDGSRWSYGRSPGGLQRGCYGKVDRFGRSFKSGRFLR